MKGSWEREHTNKLDKDYSYGYPWPPRCYTCGFCQREFKSAQALGGHMNIHRKDRAKLRDLSPDKYPLLSKNSACQNPNHNHNHNRNHNHNHNPNFNPNPNPMNTLPSPSSCPTNNIFSQQYSLSNDFKDSVDHSQGVGKCMKMISSVDYPDHNCYNDHKIRLLESNNNSAKEVMRLDLGQCLRDAKKDDDLDLELRLGI